MTTWVGRTAHEIAAAVGRGEVTATEVVAEHLAHIAAVDDRVGAFEHVFADEARQAAADVDRRPDLASLPLAGVPVAIKDVVDIRGHATCKGTRAGSAVPAEKDDPLVSALRDAGAVIMGKTRCPELCFASTTDNATGASRNPWDLERVAGGSSGGSAAALASRQVPLAIGSDGGGSIRIPSSACGVIGIKPGRDTLPRRGVEEGAHWYGLSQTGPMGTTVGDVQLMLDVLRGRAGLAPGTEFPRSLDIAVSRRAMLPVPIDPSIRHGWRAAMDVLRGMGHRLIEASPRYPLSMMAALAQRSMQGAAHDADRLEMDLDRAGRRARDVVRRGRRMRERGAPDPGPAIAWKQRADEFFSNHDLLMTPGTAGPAYPDRGWHDRRFLTGSVSSIRIAAFTGPWNLADLPAASVPTGLTPDGLPCSVQLVGAEGGEDLVLAVAGQLEEAMPWPRHAPGW